MIRFKISPSKWVNHFTKKVNSESGVILFVVLWSVVILTVLAVSLGRQSHIEMAMLKHQIGKLKAKYLAWAGINYAVEFMNMDAQDDESKNVDTLYHCGIPVDGALGLNEIFEEKELKGGYFDIRHTIIDTESDEKFQILGLQDEERLININATTTQNVYVFKHLMTVLGIEEEAAWSVAYAVIDWIDSDSTVSQEDYGAEEDFYEGLSPSYRVKNRPFDSKEELLLVKGMTKEIYDTLKDYITIFPKKGSALKINFETARPEVLKALAWSLSGPSQNTDRTDADSLVEKIINYRNGEDNTPYTADDRQIDFTDIPLNQKEQIIYLVMNQFRTKASDYFRIRVRGVERARKIEAYIDAVINRKDFTFVSWNVK